MATTTTTTKIIANWRWRRILSLKWYAQWQRRIGRNIRMANDTAYRKPSALQRPQQMQRASLVRSDRHSFFFLLLSSHACTIDGSQKQSAHAERKNKNENEKKNGNKKSWCMNFAHSISAWMPAVRLVRVFASAMRWANRTHSGQWLLAWWWWWWCILLRVAGPQLLIVCTATGRQPVRRSTMWPEGHYTDECLDRANRLIKLIAMLTVAH